MQGAVKTKKVYNQVDWTLLGNCKKRYQFTLLELSLFVCFLCLDQILWKLSGKLQNVKLFLGYTFDQIQQGRMEMIQRMVI